METTTHADFADRPWAYLIERLDSIRRRLMWSAIVVMLATIGCWAFREELFALLARPMTEALIDRGEDPRLAFTRLTDPFIVYLSVAMLGGVLLASPFVMAQVWRTIAPSGRRFIQALTFVICATGLFLAGVLFGHQVLLPFVVRYLVDIAAGLRQVVTARDYLRFALRLLIALGVTAQLPLLSFVLARFGLITARRLLRWFPYATLVAFALAALITPPDGISQVMVAVPMLGLYLVSILIAAVARPRDS